MLWLSILIPVLACGLIVAVKKHRGLISLLSLASSAVVLAVHYPGARVIEKVPWAPELGLNFTFLLDWLSYPIGLMIMMVSCAAVYYSMDYMRELEEKKIYYVALNLFAVSMLGVVLSVNMVLFYLFWDAMLVSSYFLITEWGAEGADRIGLKYFVYMSIAAVLLLLSLTWLHAATGTYNFLEMDVVHSIIYLPLITAFLIKLGAFPLHGWLPDAHSIAPSPISAMLSSLMVNVGGYGLIRFCSLFPSGIEPYSVYIGFLAVFTTILGALMVLRQDHVKRVLAWSTVSHGGYVMFGAVALTLYGLRGSGLHLVTQAVTKSLLFFVAGALIYSTGKKYVSEMDRVVENLPMLAILGFIGFLSLAGVPGLASFQSEWMIFLGGMKFPILDGLMMFGTVLTLGYCLWFLHSVFLTEGKSEGELKPVPFKMMVSMIVIGVLVVLLGIYPTPFLVGG